MSRYISAELRKFIAERADYLCEYCLIAEEDTFIGCQVDHIISLKHGGKTTKENLAFACAVCNRNKGSDIGSITIKNAFTRFYNPRIDIWSEHFKIQAERIEPITEIDEVTANILEFNGTERLLERRILISQGRYPNEFARQRIRKSN
jgi:hypothetical protein